MDNNINLTKLINYGISMKEILDNKPTLKILIDNLFLTVKELLDGGVSIKKLLDDGVTIKELLDNGVSIKEIQNNGGKIETLNVVFEKLSSNAKPKNDLQSNTTNDFKNDNYSNPTPTF